MRLLSPIIFFTVFLFAAAGTIRASEMHLEPYQGSPDFERLKNLAGIWKGTHVSTGEAPTDAAVEYAVTSNGSAVVEKLFPGTSHEMVTVYHDNKDGKPSMIHYCGFGNRPEMNLVSADDFSMSFSFSEKSDIDPAKEPHMHSLTLAMSEPGKLTH